jgi:hypothetical protein
MFMEGTTTRPEVARWGRYATLIGVLVLALFVRFQGITYGLPLDFYAPDETVKAGIVAQFRHGEFMHPPPWQSSFLLNTAYLFQFATRPFKEELLTRISTVGTMSDDMLEHAFLIWSSRLWLALIGTATCALLCLWNEIAGSFTLSGRCPWRQRTMPRRTRRSPSLPHSPCFSASRSSSSPLRGTNARYRAS